MIWLVITFLVFFCLIWLFEPIASGKAWVEERFDEHETLKDRIKSIKDLLRDLDHEYRIGKLDPTDFNSVKAELIKEWQQLEKKMTSHSKYIAFILFFFFCSFSPIDAFSLKVETRNGISGSLKKPEAIQVIKLDKGMQSILTINAPRRIQLIKDLPKMVGPYLLQVTYQDVRYSKLVTPNTKSGSRVRVNVYEKTNSFDKIKMTSLWSMRFVEGDQLENILMYSFKNLTGKTYSEPEGGIYVFLPPKATNIRVSVSSSSGLRGIQWTPVVYEKSNDPNKLSLLKYPIKPLDSNEKLQNRVYQIKFLLPYDGSKQKIPMTLPYPSDNSMVIFTQPGTIELFDDQGLKLNSKVSPKLNNEEVIHWDLNKKENRASFLTIQGGDSLPSAFQEPKTQTVEITAPLSLWEKIAILVLGAFVFFIPFLYPNFFKGLLRRYREKSLSQCLREKDQLNGADIPESVRNRRISDLDKQIKKLGKLLEDAN